MAPRDTVLTRSSGLLAKRRNHQPALIDFSVVRFTYIIHIYVHVQTDYQCYKYFYDGRTGKKIQRRQQDSNLRPQRGTDF